ncbi:hypothetical protein G7Y89_g8527 [Cudoniella acicularis]|uniref:DUF3752 domain-containing protein n=1 Tax=Cudoniella acicularis TaxID=354080 RepID=A0A8H4RIP2_9HELO|nr:hypothetical protein G7Y89_g8527 [Cudoniella acicularis]
MPSVGPELPPHLAKRKRSIDDDPEGPHSPPHKMQAASKPQEKRILGPAPPPAANPDELEVDDSSDDGYGPSAPATKPSKPQSPPRPRVAGPTLRPTINPDQLDVDDSSEDEYGPSLSKAPLKPSTPAPKKRILGPAPPPAPLSELPSHPANDSSSDSEDDYGPSLPPAAGSAEERQYLHELEQEKESFSCRESTTSEAPTRRMDNRKFASGKGAKAPAENGTGISAIWTETPEEKRKRLEDEVLGRAEAATSSRASKKVKSESKEDLETARRIREYNEKNRGQSLAAQREKNGGQKEEEDDPSKRGFDREKDMALGGRVGHVQKKDMLAKAADFGSRFQKGNYL